VEEGISIPSAIEGKPPRETAGKGISLGAAVSEDEDQRSIE